MMISQDELNTMVKQVRAKGAIVNVAIDRTIKRVEGRDIISSLQVIGLKGFGHYPVGPIAFAERVRELGILKAA